MLEVVIPTEVRCVHRSTYSVLHTSYRVSITECRPCINVSVSAGRSGIYFDSVVKCPSVAFPGLATSFCSSEMVLCSYIYREARPQVLFFEEERYGAVWLQG
jgi:hypothetical protein